MHGFTGLVHETDWAYLSPLDPTTTECLIEASKHVDVIEHNDFHGPWHDAYPCATIAMCMDADHQMHMYGKPVTNEECRVCVFDDTTETALMMTMRDLDIAADSYDAFAGGLAPSVWCLLDKTGTRGKGFIGIGVCSDYMNLAEVSLRLAFIYDEDGSIRAQ